AVDILDSPAGDDSLPQVLDHQFWRAFQWISITGTTAAETEEQIALAIHVRDTSNQFKFPISLNVAFLQDLAVVKGQRRVTFFHAFQQICLLDTDSRNWCLSVSS